MSKNRKIALSAGALVLAAALFLGIYLASRPQPAQGSKAFTVEVVHSNGETVTFSYRTDEDYLGPVLLAQGLISGSESEFGLYILEVDGEEAIYEQNGAYWALYVNGEYAAHGADETPVNDGDLFGLCYTVG